MAAKVDARMEALKELGAMIAENIRRRDRASVAKFKRRQQPEQEGNFEVIVQVQDPECDGLYTETVKVEYFLRNRKSRAKKLLQKRTGTM